MVKEIRLFSKVHWDVGMRGAKIKAGSTRGLIRIAEGKLGKRAGGIRAAKHEAGQSCCNIVDMRRVG